MALLACGSAKAQWLNTGTWADDYRIWPAADYVWPYPVTNLYTATNVWEIGTNYVYTNWTATNPPAYELKTNAWYGWRMISDRDPNTATGVLGRYSYTWHSNDLALYTNTIITNFTAYLTNAPLNARELLPWQTHQALRERWLAVNPTNTVSNFPLYLLIYYSAGTQLSGYLTDGIPYNESLGYPAGEWWDPFQQHWTWALARECGWLSVLRQFMVDEIVPYYVDNRTAVTNGNVFPTNACPPGAWTYITLPVAEGLASNFFGTNGGSWIVQEHPYHDCVAHQPWGRVETCGWYVANGSTNTTTQTWQNCNGESVTNVGVYTTGYVFASYRTNDWIHAGHTTADYGWDALWKCINRCVWTLASCGLTTNEYRYYDCQECAWYTNSEASRAAAWGATKTIIENGYASAAGLFTNTLGGQRYTLGYDSGGGDGFYDSEAIGKPYQPTVSGIWTGNAYSAQFYVSGAAPGVEADVEAETWDAFTDPVTQGWFVAGTILTNGASVTNDAIGTTNFPDTWCDQPMHSATNSSGSTRGWSLNAGTDFVVMRWNVSNGFLYVTNMVD